MLRKKITITYSKAGNNDQYNFPLLISLYSNDLKSKNRGGHIPLPEGEDIFFTSSDGLTRITYELETYNPETGELRAWVKIPELSSKEDTAIYLCYGEINYNTEGNRENVWDSSYKMVLHINSETSIYHDSTLNKNNGLVEKTAGKPDYIKISHSDSLNISKAITVEAWVDSKTAKSDTFQTIVSKWSLLPTFNTFECYNAENTSGFNMKGFFGAVFDGRYVYFVPEYGDDEENGRVLRYDTHGNFSDSKSWSAYDAGNTDGLKSIGYYGAVFDGRYVYFIPRTDGKVHHSRILRYDTKKDFIHKESWNVFDAGINVSYQSAGFDGRFIYFSPGYEGKYGEIKRLIPGHKVQRTDSGKILRYDTRGEFKDSESYAIHDAGNTSGLDTKCYDGAVFDGRYIYFVPLEPISIILRFDTSKEFTDSKSWTAYNFNISSTFKMGQCVGAIFDGQYIYFVPYANSVVARYDTQSEFINSNSWGAYDAGSTSGLKTKGYDGAVFDGKYIYFIPFWEGEDIKKGFHAKVLRYDTQGYFKNGESWDAFDAEHTSGLRTMGFNGGAFDGRYIYFSPWRKGTSPDGKPLAHGRVLRYDTTADRASFALRYADLGHNGGLCAALPGPSFIVNTKNGVLNVRANRNLEPGLHYIAGVYDGSKIKLFIDGSLVAEKSGKGAIQINNTDITAGRILDGLGYFDGAISEIRISDIARNDDWIKTEYNNISSPSDFYKLGKEEQINGKI